MAAPSPTAEPAAFDPSKAHFDRQRIAHPRQLLRARYSFDGALIAAVGLDKLVHIWETATGRHYTLGEHPTWISALVFASNEPRLYTADFHGNLRAWDARKENAAPLFSVAAEPNITRALAIAPGGNVISAGDAGLVRVWNGQTGEKLAELSGHKGRIFSLAVHPDGKRVVSGDQFGRVLEWEIATGQLVRELDATRLHTRKEEFLADVGGARALAYNADGSLLACGGLSKAESNGFCPGTPLVLIFDSSTGKERTELRLNFKSDGPFNALRFLSDGTLAACGEHMNAPTALVFWRLDKPEPFHKVTTESAYDLDLHPDGLRLLTTAFKTMGSGGNGARKQHREKYVPNSAELLTCNLWAASNPKR